MSSACIDAATAPGCGNSVSDSDVCIDEGLSMQEDILESKESCDDINKNDICDREINECKEETIPEECAEEVEEIMPEEGCKETEAIEEECPAVAVEEECKEETIPEECAEVEEIMPEEGCKETEAIEEECPAVAVEEAKEDKHENDGKPSAVISHGRSENYDQIKIIPRPKEFNATIKSPEAKIYGNKTFLIAEVNLTAEEMQNREFRMKWLIIGDNNTGIIKMGNNISASLPEGNYTITLTIQDGRGWVKIIEKEVQAIICEETVPEENKAEEPEIGTTEKQESREIAKKGEKHAFWQWQKGILFYYDNFKFCGVSWIPTGIGIRDARYGNGMDEPLQNLSPLEGLSQKDPRAKKQNYVGEALPAG
jgi:hypothetical protein